MRVSGRMVRDCQVEDDAWSLGNEVLYDLCRAHPRHVSVREVVGKVWLIGRAYAAAVERGRGTVAGSGHSNDSFYTEALAPALIESQLDERLQSLHALDHISTEHSAPILLVHGYLGLRPSE